MVNFNLIQPTIRKERKSLSPEELLEQYALKGIDAFESIKWVNGFDQIQIHKLKALADLFRLLNNITKDQSLIDEIYEKIRQKMVIPNDNTTAQ